jgi:lipopolysaccharide export system permease protein
MFMLIMQFLWKYIDDLIGKGIDLLIILELFFYVSITLIPLALPLAMLLSSIMTLGNLAENNELTALKSAGLSLFQILKPLTYVVIFICFLTFLFSNFVIPVATLKWRTLIYDIQETKIASILSPGTYSTVLEGYAIKIIEGNDHSFKEITIHDHTDPNIIKTIKADSGEVFKSKNGSYLFFKLSNGSVLEELNSNNNTTNALKNGFYPGRKSKFKDASYKVDLSGFKLNRSSEKLFKNDYEMWNVFQLNYAFDSINKNHHDNLTVFVNNTKTDHLYFISKNFNLKNKNVLKKIPFHENINPDQLVLNKNFSLEKMNSQDKIIAYQNNISRIRRKCQNLGFQMDHFKKKNDNINFFIIEIHKKFSLTFAIFVLFFVGAPLGAIVKKGGFGAPVVIAAILFLVYYIITEIGLNLATTHVLSPFFGVWLATIFLLPIAFILMRSAALDRNIFSLKRIKLKFKNLK